MIWIEIEPEVLIQWKKGEDRILREFLYENFPGSKELILRDEDEEELDRLKLEDLF